MAQIALYAAAGLFAFLAIFQATLFAFEVEINVGSVLFEPINMLAGTIILTLYAVWMIIASLDIRSDN